MTPNDRNGETWRRTATSCPRPHCGAPRPPIAAADHAEACRLERNRAVLDALAAGMTQRQVGAITGLSRARINQIQQEGKNRS
jgi:hypothetical protein